MIVRIGVCFQNNLRLRALQNKRWVLFKHLLFFPLELGYAPKEGGFMRLVLSIVLLILLLVPSPVVLAGDTIRLTTGHWPPYFGREFKHGGVGTRIVTEAFALEGIQVEYVYLPWKRGLDMAMEGAYAGAVGWRRTPERARVFEFTDPLIEVTEYFFHRLGESFDWVTLDDIGSLRVGVTNGYTSADMIRPVVEQGSGELDVASSDESGFRKLVQGRIDLFPCGEEVGYFILRTRFPPGETELISRHPRPILSGDLFLLISRKNPRARELVARFNRGLAKLKESGLYEQYMAESNAGAYLPDGMP